MVDDINFSNILSVNINTSSIDSDLLNGISASFDNNLFDTNLKLSDESCFDESLEIIPELDGISSNVLENPIVKEVFNNILTTHNIDLSNDSAVVDTLKALLYL